MNNSAVIQSPISSTIHSHSVMVCRVILFHMQYIVSSIAFVILDYSNHRVLPLNKHWWNLCTRNLGSHHRRNKCIVRRGSSVTFPVPLNVQNTCKHWSFAFKEDYDTPFNQALLNEFEQVMQRRQCENLIVSFVLGQHLQSLLLCSSLVRLEFKGSCDILYMDTIFERIGSCTLLALTHLTLDHYADQSTFLIGILRCVPNLIHLDALLAPVFNTWLNLRYLSRKIDALLQLKHLQSFRGTFWWDSLIDDTEKEQLRNSAWAYLRRLEVLGNPVYPLSMSSLILTACLNNQTLQYLSIPQTINRLDVYCISLQEVHLTSSQQLNDSGTRLQSFPNLTSFSFISNSDPIPLQELVFITALWQQTLCTLSVNVQSFQSLPLNFSATILSSFTHLTQLSLIESKTVKWMNACQTDHDFNVYSHRILEFVIDILRDCVHLKLLHIGLRDCKYASSQLLCTCNVCLLRSNLRDLWHQHPIRKQHPNVIVRFSN